MQALDAGVPAPEQGELVPRVLTVPRLECEVLVRWWGEHEPTALPRGAERCWKRRRAGSGPSKELVLEARQRGTPPEDSA